MKTLLSLFDYSGSWSMPYKEHGWRVIQIDIKLGIDILKFNYRKIKKCNGVLAAPPCTDYSNSGAQYWKQKDMDGRTQHSNTLVYKTLEIIQWFNPDFWGLENPQGRINQCIPELGRPSWVFNPSDYGENYTKKTYLWGRFIPPMPLFVDTGIGIPVPANENFIMKLGGKSERTKELRSVTPKNFSLAFYMANH